MATALQIVRRFYPEVKEVVDSKRNRSIEVTSQDSKSRAVKNHKECALAVACKRVFHADAAIICVKTAYIITGNKAIRFTNPESVRREIISFDRHAGFEPGHYSLSKVSPANAIGAKRRFMKRTGQGNGPSYHKTDNVRVISDIK